MLKNLFYAVLFIVLVVGLSFLMSTYIPVQKLPNDLSSSLELIQLKAQVEELTQLKAQVSELSLIAEQVSTMSVQLESLAQRDTTEANPIPVVDELPSYFIGKALLQALNCKYVAQNHSSARLITELTMLEETIKQLDIDQDTLLRETSLARTETVANIPSAQDRLEIIWKILLTAYQKP